jgi:hypothetical protein
MNGGELGVERKRKRGVNKGSVLPRRIAASESMLMSAPGLT